MKNSIAVKRANKNSKHIKIKNMPITPKDCTSYQEVLSENPSGLREYRLPAEHTIEVFDDMDKSNSVGQLSNANILYFDDNPQNKFGRESFASVLQPPKTPTFNSGTEADSVYGCGTHPLNIEVAEYKVLRKTYPISFSNKHCLSDAEFARSEFFKQFRNPATMVVEPALLANFYFEQYIKSINRKVNKSMVWGQRHGVMVNGDDSNAFNGIAYRVKQAAIYSTRNQVHFDLDKATVFSVINQTGGLAVKLGSIQELVDFFVSLNDELGDIYNVALSGTILTLTSARVGGLIQGSYKIYDGTYTNTCDATNEILEVIDFEYSPIATEPLLLDWQRANKTNALDILKTAIEQAIVHANTNNRGWFTSEKPMKILVDPQLLALVELDKMRIYSAGNQVLTVEDWAFQSNVTIVPFTGLVGSSAIIGCPENWIEFVTSGTMADGNGNLTRSENETFSFAVDNQNVITIQGGVYYANIHIANAGDCFATLNGSAMFDKLSPLSPSDVLELPEETNLICHNYAKTCIMPSQPQILPNSQFSLTAYDCAGTNYILLHLEDNTFYGANAAANGTLNVYYRDAANALQSIVIDTFGAVNTFDAQLPIGARIENLSFSATDNVGTSFATYHANGSYVMRGDCTNLRHGCLQRKSVPSGGQGANSQDIADTLSRMANSSPNVNLASIAYSGFDATNGWTFYNVAYIGSYQDVKAAATAINFDFHDGSCAACGCV